MKFPFTKKTGEENVEKSKKKVFRRKPFFRLPLKKNSKACIISIDIHKSMINIIDVTANDSSAFSVNSFSYRPIPFQSDFYDRLSFILEEYVKDKTLEQNMSVFLVLPNECVSLEIINIPNIKKKSIQESLDVKLNSTYKNINDLFVRKDLLFTNKLYNSFLVIALKKALIADLYKSLANNKMYCRTTTYAAVTTLASAIHFRPRTRSANALIIDIKADNSNIVISDKGKLIGYYHLQFGYSILDSNKLVYENMIVNHDFAEITVINAKEKAKAKQLTTLDSDEFSEEKTEEIVSTDDFKSNFRKVPKKLPKYMQRPLPENDEDMLFENFRIFMKWIMLVSESYKKNGLNFSIDNVIVNMPYRFKSVIDKVNSLDNESGIKYSYLNEDGNIPDQLLEYLELYGVTVLGRNSSKHTF